MRKLIFFIFYLSGSLGYSHTDDVSEIFYKRVSEKYLQKKVIQYTYKVTQFDTTGVNKLGEMTGDIFQSATRFSYHLGEIRVIFEDSFYVMVDDRRKEIYYHVIADSNYKKVQSFDVMGFIKQLRDNKIQIVKDNACEDVTLECYNMVYGKLNKDLYKIKLDKKSGYIRSLRIDYYGTDEARRIQNYILEIKYDDYKEISFQSFHPLDEYVDRVGNMLKPKDKYRFFTIKKF